MTAAVELVEAAGGEVVGITTVGAHMGPSGDPVADYPFHAVVRSE